MALTAKFTADFSQFESAIKGAAVTVTTFEKGVKNAAADLSKLASSLSGAEIQRQATLAANAIEAIGGATKLTAAEAAKMAGPIDQAIAKYKALGQQVPPELEKISKELLEVQQNAKKAGDGAGGIGAKFKSELAAIGPAVAGAFTVGALVSFGKGLVDLGGQITDTANKLGISTDAVQEFEYAANATGSSIDTFSGAMSKMQNALVEGSKGTQKALGDLNLSFDKLQKMAPDKAFTAVADAIKGVADPMKQTQIAMELFGKAGVEMLPAIREGMSGLQQAAHDANQVISKEGVQALDDFGDMAAETYKRMQVGAAQMAVGVIKAIGDIDTAFKSMSGGARAKWDQDLDELDRRIQQSQYQMDRLLAQEVIKPPPLPPAPSGFGVGTGQADANKLMEEGAKRANDLADAHIEAGKAAAKHAEAIRQLRDQLSGAALQADIKKLAQAWDGLTKEQKENDAVLKRIVPTLEDYVQAGGKLPPILQEVFDAHRRVSQGVRDLTGGYSNAIAILNRYADAVKGASGPLVGFTQDGVKPATNALRILEPFLEKGADWTKTLGKEFYSTGAAAAELARQAKGLEALDLGASLGGAVSGFFGDDLKAGIKGFAADMGGILSDSLMKGIAEGIKAGTISAGAGMVQGFAASMIVPVMGMMIDTIIGMMEERSLSENAHRAGEAIATEFQRGFGGREATQEVLERAGATNDQISRVMNGTLEAVKEGIAEVTPLINRYNEIVGGLGRAGTGAGQMAEGLAAQFAPAIKEQRDALVASQAAMLEYEKAAGASAERIKQLQDKFKAESEGQVFTATAENVDRIKGLGTIIGGVIANTVGHTGDLVGALNSVGPALDQISKMREQFGLTGEQLGPVTSEVLKLYDAVRGNEDVFSVVQGLGEVMNGMGSAFINNAELANAFGGELAAQFTILKDRGVDANLALATMAPQLQELWELSEQGHITVDETTQALLDQAEAQGIVGSSMQDANKQILDVLVEIRDMFQVSLPNAIARTGSTHDAAAGQINRGINTNREAAERLGTAIGPQLGIAARTGQLAVLTAAQEEQIALEKTKKEAEKLAAQLGPGVQNAAGIAGSAIDALSRRSITIPIHFDMDEPPDMPDYPSPEPPTQPGDAGTAQAASAPQSAGHTEVNFNVDGNTLARIVASKLPGVVNSYVVN